MKRRKPVILFSTYGGHRLGTGHIFRDLELARLLRSDATVLFHANKSRGAARILSERGVTRVFSGSLARVIREMHPDIIVYDRPYALGPVKGADKRGKAALIALDYFYYDDKNVDVAINIKNHHLNRLTPRRIRRIYEGEEYAIVRKELLSPQGGNKYPAKNVKNILITFGGADPRNNTRKAMRILDGITGPFRVVVILGHVFKKGLEYAARSASHTYVVKSRVLRMGPLMRQADLVICGGGTTMMEALTLGRPVVIMPQNKDERSLARDLEMENAALVVGPLRSLRSARRAVKNLIGSARARLRMSQKGQDIFDGRGAERIRTILMRELGAA